MIWVDSFILSLIAVFVVSFVSIASLVRANITEKLRSSSHHPANFGKTAIQVGGLVIIPVTVITGLVYYYLVANISLYNLILFAIPVLFLFAIGVIDDINPISAPIRLAAHLVNAGYITVFTFELTGFIGLREIITWVGFFLPAVFMLLAITWMINSINFIDGMDWFLVSTILPGVILYSSLQYLLPQGFLLSNLFLLLLSALLAFSWFNKPSASVYMGDAGTLCIGLFLGINGIFILAVYGSIAGFMPFAYILVDTTYTLIIRIFTKLHPFKSHNHHAYQIARRNGCNETVIRGICFLSSIFNTLLALVCFEMGHTLAWQLMLGGIALMTSSGVFMFLRSDYLKSSNSTA
jgi:UDP-N-acetylmuramyl pentapeptide phosphotransferase/UDP-N-acetylglucosamine-1-phosphate transferase